MKRKLSDLEGYSIAAKDGDKGTVKNFLFDENNWVIRYMEADLGNFFSGKQVLIPYAFLQAPDWEGEHFHVELSKEEIENSPLITAELPVSRKYEEELHTYYTADYYWMNTSVAPMITYPINPLATPTKLVDEKDIDTSIRSFNEIQGYTVKTTDGTIGHIADLIINDANWQIVYAVVDTSDWMPWSKKVLVAVDWMENISYVNHEIAVTISTDAIESAPEFDGETLNDEYEKKLHQHYDLTHA